MVYVSSMFSHVLRIVIVIRIVVWKDFAFRRRVVNLEAGEMEEMEEMEAMEAEATEVGDSLPRKLLLFLLAAW
jgi:hypothetical protein